MDPRPPSSELLELTLQRWREEPLACFDTFLAHQKVRGRPLRSTSFRVYRGMFQRLLAWLEDHQQELRTLRGAQVEAFLDERALGTRTRHRYLLVFNRLCEHLRGLGALGHNPARALLLQHKAPEAPAPRWLSPEQVQRLVPALREVGVKGWKRERLGTMARLILTTGLRSREILELRLEELELQDLEQARLLVRARPPHPGRTLTLNAHVRADLQTWLQTRNTAKLQGPLVFCASPTGAELSAASLFRHVRQALQHADIELDYEGPALLRNTCAGAWLASHPLIDVQRWLGHKRAATTLEFLPAAQAWQQADMNELLFSPRR